MSGPIAAIPTLRRAATAVALSVVLMVGLGVGPAAAGDEHVGGVSDEVESIDEGRPPSDVAGVTVTRPGGGPSGFAFTGSDLLGLAALGAATVAAGAGARKLSKRRRTARANT